MVSQPPFADAQLRAFTFLSLPPFFYAGFYAAAAG